MKNMSPRKLQAMAAALAVVALLGLQALVSPDIIVGKGPIGDKPEVKMNPTAAAKLEQLHSSSADRHREIEADAKSGTADADPKKPPLGTAISKKASVSPEEAISKAKGTNTEARVGSVKLEDRKGTSVYVIDVEGKDVVVDATSGAVLASPADEASTKAISPEEAISKAKGTNTEARVGSVKLEDRKGKPVYVISIEGKDVVVDAATGDPLAN